MYTKNFKLNPAEYEFIWRVDNFDYFFFSFWLHDKYKKMNFLFTYKDKKWKTYIGKDQRKKLSIIGKILIAESSRLKNYEARAMKLINHAKKVFSKTKGENYSQFSDKKIADKIAQIAKFYSRFWAHYFFTEYFFCDEIEKILSKRLGTEACISKIKRNVFRMQEIKFKMRKYLNKSIFENHAFLELLEESAKRLNVDFSRIVNLGWFEIAEAIVSKKLKVAEKNTYVMGRFNNWKIISGHGAKKLIKRIENYEKKHAGNVLRGQSGNRGNYIGKVKIIPFDIKADLINEINKMKKGDVLVSGSTGPEMILACQKAGAIITEEGGITSHAAIVSRELGIPSVIGTKIATEVLKDGDLVEVDANHGIVKIIKRAK